MVGFGYCDPHYRRWKKYGDPGSAVINPPSGSIPLMDRFMVKVDQRGDTECWPWLARKLPTGYGIFYRDGRYDYAHRVSYELHVEPIPTGLTIDHVLARGCVSRSCVNPAHLEPVTMRENTLRSSSPAAMQARQTHCKRGHEFTPANTYVHRGARHCKACRADRRSAERG